MTPSSWGLFVSPVTVLQPCALEMKLIMTVGAQLASSVSKNKAKIISFDKDLITHPGRCPNIHRKWRAGNHQEVESPSQSITSPYLHCIFQEVVMLFLLPLFSVKCQSNYIHCEVEYPLKAQMTSAIPHRLLLCFYSYLSWGEAPGQKSLVQVQVLVSCLYANNAFWWMDSCHHFSLSNWNLNMFTFIPRRQGPGTAGLPVLKFQRSLYTLQMTGYLSQFLPQYVPVEPENLCFYLVLRC